MNRLSIRFEIKIEDLWVGLFWRNVIDQFDLWICFIPCVPLHVRYRKKPPRR